MFVAQHKVFQLDPILNVAEKLPTNRVKHIELYIKTFAVAYAEQLISF